VGEETFVSRHCDLTVPVTFTMPSACSPIGTHCSSEFVFVLPAFHHMCGICFGIFSCCSYASREVWTAWSDCDILPTSWLGNSGNTLATLLLYDFARDGLPHCCELALFCMSVPRLLDRLPATRRHLVAAGTGHPLLRTALYRAGADH